MRKLPSVALAVWTATLLPVGVPDAQAKQQCSATKPSNQHGRWWSYRLIDGRKCWYEGKPMLSKELLEWRKEASAKPVSKERVSSTVAQKSGNPLDAPALMDAGARALRDSETFEALWRERVDIQ